MKITARSPIQGQLDAAQRVEARALRPRDEKIEAMVRLGASSGRCRLCGHFFLRAGSDARVESCSDECKELLDAEPHRFVDDA